MRRKALQGKRSAAGHGAPWGRRLLALPLFLTALALGGGLILVRPAWGEDLALATRTEDSPSFMLDTPRKPVQALDFTADSLGGKSVHLSTYRGQVVLLNFWATWCVPCLEEMPSLSNLARKLSGQKIKVLAVNLQESADKVREFGRTHPFAFDLLLDPNGEISSHYGVVRIPITYIVDQQGYIIRRAVGPRLWDGSDALKFFHAQLGASRGEPATAMRPQTLWQRLVNARPRTRVGG